MSIFVPFVTNTQLFLNDQPFSPLKMRLFCSLPLSSFFCEAQRKAPLGQKAKRLLPPLCYPPPPQERAPIQISATKADSRPVPL